MKFTEADISQIFQQIEGFSALNVTVQRVFSGTNFVSIVSGSCSECEKKAVFREFGSSDLIDPQRERRTFDLASNSGVGPKVLLETLEYRIEEFLEGRTMERTACSRYLKKTAEALAEFHSLIDTNSSSNSTLDYLYHWRSKFTETLSSSASPRISNLLQQVESNFNQVLTWQSWPVSENVFCHNDFSYGNLIVQEDRVRIIDFEYSGPGHPSTDLASFLIETMFDFSHSEYRYLPQDELPLEDQKLFVFHYCQIRNLDSDEMWKKVQKSKTIVSFLAVLWAGCNFSQAKPSMIDYAFNRLELFERFKNELA